MTNLLFEALIRVYLERFRLTGRIGTDRPGMMRWESGGLFFDIWWWKNFWKFDWRRWRGL